MAGAEVSTLPRFTGAEDLAKDLPADAVLLLPLTRSTATVAWSGFRELADSLNGRAIFAGGRFVGIGRTGEGGRVHPARVFAPPDALA